MMGSGFLAPDLEPLTATLEAVMGSRGQDVMGSRGLGGTPSKPLSALIGSGSGTCYVILNHTFSNVFTF